MNVSYKLLENLYTEFVQYIKSIKGEIFQTFATSQFLIDEEHYKYKVYEEARESLGNKFWKPEDIGTGKIQQAVSSAIQPRVIYNYRVQENNLIDWRKKDDFSKLPQNRALELTLFNFYKNKIKNSDAFEQFIQEGLTYQFIAYLFFIKDSVNFVPISQKRFDAVFELIGLPEFKTTNNGSWENYNEFCGVIKQVRDFLKVKDKDTTLIDAHTFLFVMGSRVNEDKPTIYKPTPEDENPFIDTEPLKPEQTIVEEDDELAFPEGKEVFRLHKSKERNKELIKTAKEKRLQTDPKLCCQVCGFSFADKYGELGEGFIEVHHLYPISELTEETETKIDDLAMACSNCHRMLHRRRPWLTLHELRNMVK